MKVVLHVLDSVYRQNFSRVVIENLLSLTSPIYTLTFCNLLNFSVPCMIIHHMYVPLQEREMGGGVFYDPLYRETSTQELHMLTK